MRRFEDPLKSEPESPDEKSQDKGNGRGLKSVVRKQPDDLAASSDL